MADLTSTGLSADFVATLAHAAAHELDRKRERPSAKAVVNALLQAEKAAKQQRLTYPLELLLGDWRLCFVAPRKAHLRGGIALGKGLYIPQIAKAQLCFSTQEPSSAQSLSQVKISNFLQFGSLLFKLTGPAQYLGKKNITAFDFTHIQISLFNRAIYSGDFRGGKAAAMDFHHQSFAKLPFFAFFLVTEDFIAARGRGGGVALWVKSA